MQRILIDNRDGYGLRDYTKFFWEADQFLQETRNQPTLFDFKLSEVPGSTTWVLPKRGATIRFEDTRWDRSDDGTPGVLFTGVMTGDPEYIFLGTRNGQEVYGYACQATSEDYKLNIKQLTQKTYINRTRGYILKDLIVTMYDGASEVLPFDLSGVLDGGVERIYTVDVAKKWTEISAEFGKADGYTYRVHDGRVFYRPVSQDFYTQDPSTFVFVDPSDPRYTPSNLSLRRVSTDIYNDVTVLGEDEAGPSVTDCFVSDGYQSSFELSETPFGVEQSILVDDPFSDGSINSTTWQETDTGNHITMFEGTLNVTGGPGGSDRASLVLRKGIELGGLLEFRDGELQFVPTATGQAYVGTLYTSDTLLDSSIVFGWKLLLDVTGVNPNGPAIVPVGPGGVLETSALRYIDKAFGYVLRKTVRVDQVRRSIASFTGALETGNVFEDSTVVQTNASVIWTLDEIDTTDPENVFTRRYELLSKSYTNIADYALYAAVASVNGKVAMNSVRVSRPSQVEVALDGKVVPGFVASYLDGGKAEVQVSDSSPKLSFYAVNKELTASTYFDTVVSDKPRYYWRMGTLDSDGRVGQSGTLLDEQGKTIGVSRYRLIPAGGYVANDGGVISNDADGSILFNGVNGRATTESPLPFPNGSFSIEAWIKTTTQMTTGQFAGIASNRPGGLFFGLYQGKALFYDDTMGSPGLDGLKRVDDGKPHHICATYDATTDKARLWVDGALEVEVTKPSIGTYNATLVVGAQNASALEYYFPGNIDELAIYDRALSKTEVASHVSRGSYFISDAVTIPSPGTKVTVKYWRKQQAKARVTSQASIRLEKQRFGDDGVRQKILQPNDLKPVPRSSRECMLLGRAYLDDYTTKRYEGSYSFVTLANNETELRRWIHPGDCLWLKVSSIFDSDEQRANGVKTYIESVSSRFLGNEAYEISLSFGPVNEFEERQRQLLISRKSLADVPELTSFETITADNFDTELSVYPPDLLHMEVQTLNGPYVSFKCSVPAGASVDGYEIRSTDANWGSGTGVIYASAGSGISTTFSWNRDVVYYARAYKTTSGTKYFSRNAARIRLSYPLMSPVVYGVTGDISASRCQLVLPSVRDKDFLAFVVRKDSSTGDIVYYGDGIYSKQQMAGVSAYFDGGKLILDVPNPAKLTSMTFNVNAVNTLGTTTTLGTQYTIDRVVPVLTTSPTASANKPNTVTWGGTAPEWTITEYENNTPINSWTVPGGTTSYTYNNGGRDRTYEVTPKDSFGGATPGTLVQNGDTDVPGAPTLTATVSTSVSSSNQQILGTTLTWTVPTNANGLILYEWQAHANTSFTTADPSWEQYEVRSGDDGTFGRFAFYSRQGVTRYFRVRAANAFGYGPWSNVVSSSAPNVLDALANGGSWSAGSPVFRGDVRAGGGGNYQLADINTYSGYAADGLSAGGFIRQDIPQTVDALDDNGTPYRIVVRGDNVQRLSNGTNVYNWATYADTGLNADGSIKINIPFARKYVDGSGTGQDIAYRALTLGAFSGGNDVVGYANLANTGFDGNGYLKTRILSSVKIRYSAIDERDPATLLTDINSFSDVNGFRGGAALAKLGLVDGGYVGLPLKTLKLFQGGIERNLIHSNMNVYELANGPSVEEGSYRGNQGLLNSGDIARNIPSSIQMYDGGWLRPLWLVGSTSYDLDDMNDGSVYARTTPTERDGANRAWYVITTDYYFVGGWKNAVNGQSLYSQDVHEFLMRAGQAIGSDIRINDDVVDSYSIRPGNVNGVHINSSYRAGTGLTYTGSGYNKNPEY